MLVKEANFDKINQIIKEAEGRATARCINAKDIEKALGKIEVKLGIAKKDMVGIKVEVDINAQEFPRAYKYTPDSTHFDAVRKKGGWDITNVYRSVCRRTGVRVELTEEAKKAIIATKETFTV